MVNDLKTRIIWKKEAKKEKGWDIRDPLYSAAVCVTGSLQ
jgi:hypothetical protein